MARLQLSDVREAVWSHPENVTEHIRLREGGRFLQKLDRHDKPSSKCGPVGMHV